MIVEITSSGGIAGPLAGTMHKSVDVATLSEDTREEYCTAFDPTALQALADPTLESIGADRMTYKIIVTDKDNNRHVFELREDALPPETLDLIDAM